MKTKTWIAIFSATMIIILAIASIGIVVVARRNRMRRAYIDSGRTQSDYTEISSYSFSFHSYPDSDETHSINAGRDEDNWQTSATDPQEAGNASSHVGDSRDSRITETQRVVSIDIRTLPHKTVYYIGDSLSKSGLTVDAVFASGERKSIGNESLRFSAPNMSVPGSKDVDVQYMDPLTNALFTATFTIQIKRPQITLSENDLRVFVGENYSLSAITMPAGCAVQWESASSKIANVSGDGTVTGVGSGNTTITASITYNGIKYFSDACFVAVSLKNSEISIENAKWYDGYYDEYDQVFSLHVSGTAYSNYKLDTVEIGWYGAQYINGTYSPDFRRYYVFEKDEINGYTFDLDQGELEFEAIPGETYILYIYIEDVRGGTDMKTCEITAE